MPKKAGAAGLRVKLDHEAMTVQVQVVKGEGDDQRILDQDVFAFGDLPDGEVKNLTCLYGLSKVLQDRTSDEKDKVAKLKEMSEVMDRLMAGEWEKERVAGFAPVVSPEVEALAQLKKITIPQAQAALRNYDKAQRDKILSNDAVVTLAKEIREKREAAAEAQDLSDLL